MSLERYWDGVRDGLDEALARAAPAPFAMLDPAGRAELRRAVSSGKRIRACLLCLACDALGGARAAAIPRAVAVECVHAASLIHDDLVDGDALRRDAPATWRVAGVRRSVLLADVLFATAIERMAALGPAETRVIGRAIAAMAGGAYREQAVRERLAGAPGDPGASGPEDGYDAIVAAKTGSLFEAAGALGALAAGATGAALAHAARCGAEVGRTYQLADDLCDLEPGAAAGSDVAAILPLLLRFAGRTRPRLVAWLRGGPGAGAPDPRVLDAVRSNLRAAARAAGGRAEAAIDGFPPGRHRALLRELLASALRAQVADLEL